MELNYLQPSQHAFNVFNFSPSSYFPLYVFSMPLSSLFCIAALHASFDSQDNIFFHFFSTAAVLLLSTYILYNVQLMHEHFRL